MTAQSPDSLKTEHPDALLPDSLANRVKIARLRLNMTKRELANRANVQEAAIGKVEGGRVKRPGFILELARALNVEPDWLQFGLTPMEAATKQFQKRAVPIAGTSQEKILALAAEITRLTTEEQAKLKSVLQALGVEL